ncbi:hypothetical protein ACAG39_01915 [Caldicellulosiruptoraceae bacterium PP1]
MKKIIRMITLGLITIFAITSIAFAVPVKIPEIPNKPPIIKPVKPVKPNPINIFIA